MIAEKEAESDQRIDGRVAQLLNRRLELNLDGGDLNLRKVNAEAGLPMAFGACHIYTGLHPWELLQRPTKQEELWELFLLIEDERPEPYTGVVFNSEGHGRWIIHNLLELRGKAHNGRQLVCYLSDHPFIAEKFTQFCTSFKETV